MAAWRHRALELFPPLRRELNDPEHTIYILYFDPLPMVYPAHDEGDDETLRRIDGSAEWCLTQGGRHLRNAAGVAFYEHLSGRSVLGPFSPSGSGGDSTTFRFAACWSTRLGTSQLQQ